jgi:hypothetical protein
MMATQAFTSGECLVPRQLECDSHIQNSCCLVGFVCRKDKNIEEGGWPPNQRGDFVSKPSYLRCGSHGVH